MATDEVSLEYLREEEMAEAMAVLCNTTLANMSSAVNCSEGYFYFDEPSFVYDLVPIVVPILFGIIVIVGLFGNALVVIVVLCNPQMRSTTNLLIINLAMADLLFIVFCVPFTAWDYGYQNWIFGEVWCKVVQYLIVVCAYASIYTLVLMSIDRFLAVVHPIASISIRTEQNASRAILVTWLTILVVCIPAILTHEQTEYYNVLDGTMYKQCRFSDDYSRSTYQVCFFLFAYVIPLIIVFLLYVLMLKRLWFGAVPGGRMSSESVRSKKRVTRMVVVVVVIFAVCWCPIQIVLVLKAFDAYHMNPAQVVTQIVAHVLAYMNSCVNPILYAFLSENFRKAFNKVIACHRGHSAVPTNRREETTAGTNGANEITMVTCHRAPKITNGNV
ncbi:Allatostatin-A receptor [Halotydeus destructor]|nr:Allatostatin-A receptor [Halotydeus destructor]